MCWLMMVGFPFVVERCIVAPSADHWMWLADMFSAGVNMIVLGVTGFCSPGRCSPMYPLYILAVVMGEKMWIPSSSSLI